MGSLLMLQAMKAASKELRTAFKRDELNISGIEKLQDDMADIMVPICGNAVVPSCICPSPHRNHSANGHGRTLHRPGWPAMQAENGLAGPTCQRHGMHGGEQRLTLCFQSCGRQDTHNDIQDVLGQNYGVPDDIDEEELLGELDDLEADMAFEAERGAASGTIPSYLQVPAQLCPTIPCYPNEAT